MNPKIREMFRLQDVLNTATNGQKWLDGITNQDKTINWDRAIHLECAELIESFPWKHWKAITQQPDMSNAQIEAVDIWHFLMSSLMEVEHLLEGEDKDYFTEQFRNIFENEELLSNKTECKSKSGFDVEFDVQLEDAFNQINKEWTIEEHKQIDRFIKPFETLEMFALLSIQIKKALREQEFTRDETIRFETGFFNPVTIKKAGKDNLDIQGLTTFYIVYTLQFFIASKLLNLQLDELYRIYLGKNLLNQFRQNFGYKEGTYVKVWNGEEDNVVMLRIIEEHPDGTYDEIYEKIEVIYKGL